MTIHIHTLTTKSLRVLPNLCAVLLFVSLTASKVSAASTDIISASSPVRDSLARLAADGSLRADASELIEDPVLTRADAALLLEKGLGLTEGATITLKKAGETAAIRELLVELRPELLADHVDVDAILKTLSSNSLSYLGVVQPEARIETGGSKNSQGSGAEGIYRAAVIGDLGRSTQYGISVSNQSEDNRRVFTNDIGPQDFSALEQAYVKFNGARGLSVLVGRTDNNWGPAAQGGALLSDNAPPLDQLRVSLPFSLGSLFGRDWNYTQLASTYTEAGQRKYLQDRRIERTFSSHWSADYEEALKSTSSSLLARSPLPFLIAKGINLSKDESQTEFIANVGVNYSANSNLHTYGQLLINDIKSPFRGHVAGLDLGNGGTTPQRLAYVVGIGYDSHVGTSAVLEYSTADPTTYQDSQPSLSWTKGAHDYLGLPDGPNFKQIYVIASQRILPKVTFSLEGRYRKRFSNSFPAPQSQDVAASARYQFDSRNSFSLTYHDYYQDAFPLIPGGPNYPSNALIPVSEGNPGTNQTVHELDAGYELVF